MAETKSRPSSIEPRAPLVLDAVADPAAVADAWREIETGGGVLPFQAYDWVEAWIAAGATPPGSRPLVIRGRRGGTTEFLLPLVIERVGPVTVARRLAGSHAGYVLGAWRDLAAEIPPAEIRTGLLAVGRAAGVDAFVLDAVPTVWDGVANPLVAALPHAPSLDDGHVFRLGPSFDALLAGRNAGHKRKKVKAKEKLLVAAGDYRVSIAATSAEVEATLAAFFDQKSASLAARGIADPFAPTAVRDAFRRLAHTSLGSAAPLVELTRLEAGGKIRAVIGASIRGGRLYALFASFAEDELARASPGETLFFRHIEEACRRGLAVYDMGPGRERYKASWCDETVELVDLRLPVTLAGHLFLAVATAVGRAKAAIRRNERAWAFVAGWRARLAGRGATRAAQETGDER
ncbi:GNAT family N-acetyltransferase [Pinisolibacter sp.]|uniref:GNAT family N-acetyltransferase n=1 Tax=Pinisolibacter sp. TaxID=2172024 RepID=UPI002FDE2378